MNRTFWFYFVGFVVPMGIYTYFRHDNLPIYLYLLLIPFGALTASSMCKFHLSHMEKIQDEIDSSDDELVIASMAMNHISKYISYGGIGVFREKEFIFTRRPGSKKLTIILSDIIKTTSYSTFFSKGIKVYLKDGKTEHFIVKSDDLNKVMMFFSQKSEK